MTIATQDGAKSAFAELAANKAAGDKMIEACA
jgi:hypothetical protein